LSNRPGPNAHPVPGRPAFGRAMLAAPILASLFAITPARAADVESARAFLEGIAAETLGILEQTEPDSPERQAGLSAVLEQGFDLPYLAQLAVGQPWRDLDEAERQRFVEVFSDWALASQSQRLGQYSGEQFEVTNAQEASAEDVMVSTEISGGKLAEPVAVDWRVRTSDGENRIIDVVVEGVSMVVTYRGEFQPIVQEGGVDALLNELEARSGGN
jgi:phospholipid transport system substrate-binding protein